MTDDASNPEYKGFLGISNERHAVRFSVPNWSGSFTDLTTRLLINSEPLAELKDDQFMPADLVAPVDGSVFAKIYENEEWGGSGPGSHPYYTSGYRVFLERFIYLNQIRSMIDLGCGDWQFSKFLNLDFVQYAGFDVVPGLIERNRRLYGSPQKKFSLLPSDLTTLPNADLLVMKDVLQHLPNKMIYDYVRLVFPRYKFCLITNSYEKGENPRNLDIEMGSFRCIDLTADPFNVPGSYVYEYSIGLSETIRCLLISS